MKLPPEPWRACQEGACSCGLIYSVGWDGPIARVLHRNEEEGVDYPRDEMQALARLYAKAGETRRLLAECAAAVPGPLARRVTRHLADLDER